MYELLMQYLKARQLLASTLANVQVCSEPWSPCDRLDSDAVLVHLIPSFLPSPSLSPPLLFPFLLLFRSSSPPLLPPPSPLPLLSPRNSKVTMPLTKSCCGVLKLKTSRPMWVEVCTHCCECCTQASIYVPCPLLLFCTGQVWGWYKSLTQPQPQVRHL